MKKVLITLLMITLHTPAIKSCSSRARTLKSPCSSQQLFLYINSDVWCLAESVCSSIVHTQTHQILHVVCAIDIPAVLDFKSNAVAVSILKARTSSIKRVWMLCTLVDWPDILDDFRIIIDAIGVNGSFKSLLYNAIYNSNELMKCNHIGPSQNWPVCKTRPFKIWLQFYLFFYSIQELYNVGQWLRTSIELNTI